jgi:hypothetical protein
MNEHEIHLLKEYMQDLVEQARQESKMLGIAGYREQPYTAENALLDLLAVLDDRVESEGVQVGLAEDFPHRMWGICQDSRQYVKDTAWMVSNLGPGDVTKTRVREVAYKALLDFIKNELG